MTHIASTQKNTIHKNVLQKMPKFQDFGTIAFILSIIVSRLTE